MVGTGGRVLAAWESGRPRWMPEEFDWVVGCSYRGQPTIEAPIRNPIGCSMSFRRAAARDAGGFRSGIGRVGALLTGGEETDLAIRIRRRQPESRILYEPRSTVRHHLPAGRARWAYFRSRCYHEGRSKAILARLEGTRVGSRRSGRMRPGRCRRAWCATWARSCVATGAAHSGRRRIIAGLAITTAGYVIGRIFDRGPLAETVPLAQPRAKVP